MHPTTTPCVIAITTTTPHRTAPYRLSKVWGIPRETAHLLPEYQSAASSIVLHTKFWSHSRVSDSLRASDDAIASMGADRRLALSDLSACERLLLKAIAKAYRIASGSAAAAPEDHGRDNEHDDGVAIQADAAACSDFGLVFGSGIVDTVGTGAAPDRLPNDASARTTTMMSAPLPMPVETAVKEVRDVLHDVCVFNTVLALFKPDTWRRAHIAYALETLNAYDSADGLLAKLSGACEKLSQSSSSSTNSSALRQASNNIIVQVRYHRYRHHQSLARCIVVPCCPIMIMIIHTITVWPLVVVVNSHC